MAIFAGGLAAIAPGRTGIIAKVAFRALIAATPSPSTFYLTCLKNQTRGN